MSENISLEEIKKFWPSSAPNINNINKYVEKYQGETIVIKYGGSALIDKNIFNNFIEDIGILNKLGLSIIVVHGGGPRIKRELEKSGIPTKFINGLRVTDENIINIVERVLIEFNNDIVKSLNEKGFKAVKQQQLFNNDLRVNAKSGNDYWESGVINPHIILKDLIEIFHPQIIEHELYYYRKLE